MKFEFSIPYNEEKPVIAMENLKPVAEEASDSDVEMKKEGQRPESIAILEKDIFSHKNPKTEQMLDGKDLQRLIREGKAVIAYKGFHDISEKDIDSILKDGVISREYDDIIIPEKEIARLVRRHRLGIKVGGGVQSFSDSALTADGYALTDPYKNKSSGMFSWLKVFLKKFKIIEGKPANPRNKNVVVEVVIPKELIRAKNIIPLPVHGREYTIYGRLGCEYIKAIYEVKPSRSSWANREILYQRRTMI